MRDCLPSCIANLRRNCERPAVDAGACTAAPGVFCYSNGVRESPASVDGGLLTQFTLPDGRTICYQVAADPSGLEHFQSAAGQEVAQGMFVRDAGAGTFRVTCDGTTQVVNINEPSCATLNSASCQAGVCP